MAYNELVSGLHNREISVGKIIPSLKAFVQQVEQKEQAKKILMHIDAINTMIKPNELVCRFGFRGIVSGSQWFRVMDLASGKGYTCGARSAICGNVVRTRPRD